MRLKEKLAHEYQEKRFNEFGSFTDQEAPYLAGFEKAREIALYEYRKTARTSFIDRLENLGEEEVHK